MGNPLFNMLGGGMPEIPMNKMIQDYKKFRQEMQGKNPQKKSIKCYSLENWIKISNQIQQKGPANARAV